jgi:hypothetical protein
VSPAHDETIAAASRAETHRPDAPFVRWTARALAAGGVLTALINLGLTPLLPAHAPYARTAASSLFLWRQALSALAAALLLAGSVGVYLRQAARAGRFGAVAFAVAFLGSALLFATEWAEVFLVRTLAVRTPEALTALEAGHGPTLYDLGAMAALGVFELGWIALAGWSLRAGVVSRRGPALVIAGLLVIPLLGAVAGTWGAVAGNVVLGAGWFVLGRDLEGASAGGSRLTGHDVRQG